MYEIYFYEDKDGKSPIFEYIQDLSQCTDKDSRINHNKINDYIEVLSEYGKTQPESLYKTHRRRYMGAYTDKRKDILCKLDRQRVYIISLFPKEITKDPSKRN